MMTSPLAALLTVAKLERLYFGFFLLLFLHKGAHHQNTRRSNKRFDPCVRVCVDAAPNPAALHLTVTPVSSSAAGFITSRNAGD